MLEQLRQKVWSSHVMAKLIIIGFFPLKQNSLFCQSKSKNIISASFKKLKNFAIDNMCCLSLLFRASGLDRFASYLPLSKFTFPLLHFRSLILSLQFEFSMQSYMKKHLLPSQRPLHSVWSSFLKKLFCFGSHLPTLSSLLYPNSLQSGKPRSKLSLS